ncbi:hypothetical protein [Pararhodospirillum photometricum]|uniref:hypothetical protein n=1 Tax=Pararhodospirillum photometricum TaxID=1084 RepID=UPI0012FEE4E7|nr:hypothetical protein [Pararhodospirillum photometricum]
MQERETDGAPSPFGFWAGFWLGLDAVSTVFQGPSLPPPARYPHQETLASDWAAVRRDYKTAVRQMKETGLTNG